MATRWTKAAQSACTLEALEERRLMAGEPWGTVPKFVGQELAAANYPAITGTGAIAVLDTGIDYMHPALGGGFGPGHKVIAGYDFADNDADPMDTDGHGTGVAGIIAANPFIHAGAKYQGIAPNTKLIALRTEPGTWGWSKLAPKLELALQWVIDHKAQYNIVAVNMSTGRGHYTDETMLDPIADELATLKSMGVVLVASSGNDGVMNPLGIEYPAADPNVIAVGSVNTSDQISSFTERGPTMDLLAPGENVPTIYYLPAENRHITLAATGTSFAVGWISGAAAVLKQIDPTLSPDEILSILQRSGVNKFDSATGLTWPRININNAIGLTLAERDDAFENNDNTVTATPVEFSSDVAYLDNLKLLIGDRDYYFFELDEVADLHFSAIGGDFSVDLLDASGNIIQGLDATDSFRLFAGTYFIRVNAAAATLAGTYGFSLIRTPDDGLNNHTLATAATITLTDGTGEITDLLLFDNVDDFFSFTLDTISDTNLAINPTLAGQLLDHNGHLIAHIDGALSKRLSAGTYFIKLSSSVMLDGTYGVSISATPFVVPGANGTMNSIAYDAAGTLHFAYYDEAVQLLKYATRSADGVWSNSTIIDPTLLSGQYVSLTIAPTGQIAVAYYNPTQGDLMYAALDNGAWNIATVDSRFTTGYYPSLAFNNAGTPAISYYYKNGGDLKFALFGGAAWNVTVIDSAGDVGRYPNLARHPATGRFAVAYENSTNGDFKYAEMGKSTWAVQTVDASTKTGGGSISLAFDKNNRPAFSYYDAANADLKFARHDGVKWLTQTVAAKSSQGLYSNLRIDQSTGDIDILYFHKGANAVFRAAAAAGKFTLTQLLSDAGRWLTRAINPFGQQTIATVKADGLEVVDL